MIRSQQNGNARPCHRCKKMKMEEEEEERNARILVLLLLRFVFIFQEMKYEVVALVVVL